MEYLIRQAGLEDLDSIVQMLADDKLGAIREQYETPLPRSIPHRFSIYQQRPKPRISGIGN